MGDGQVVSQPGVAAPLPVLRVLLLLLLVVLVLLLPVVDFQQVLLHAVGDLWTQMPDEHTTVEANERCGRGRTVTMEVVVP